MELKAVMNVWVECKECTENFYPNVNIQSIELFSGYKSNACLLYNIAPFTF